MKEREEMKKRIWKRYLIALTVCILCCLMLPNAASAAVKYEKTKAVYMNSRDAVFAAYGEIVVTGQNAKEVVVKTSVKSNKPSVVSITGVTRKIQTVRKGNKTVKEYISVIGMNVFNPRSARVSFQIGNKKYSVNVRGLSYVNPVSEVTITGVKSGKSANLARETANIFFADTLKVKSRPKNSVLKIKAASGWKVMSVECYKVKTKQRKRYSDRGSTSKIVQLGKLDGQVQISITMKNSKNGGTQTLQYNLI